MKVSFVIYIAFNCFMSISQCSDLRSQQDHTVVITYPYTSESTPKATTSVKKPEATVFKSHIKGEFKREPRKLTPSKSIYLLENMIRAKHKIEPTPSISPTTVFGFDLNQSYDKNLLLEETTVSGPVNTSTTTSVQNNRHILNSTENIYAILKKQNLKLFNVSNSEPILLSIDNRAKEIILLSASFATMLLSTCFLVFILGFCCFTIMKQKKISARTDQLKRCLRETEYNLNKIGIQFVAPAETQRKGESKIQVRDANKNQPDIRMTKVVTEISSPPTKVTTTNTMTTTVKSSSSGCLTENQIFHPYDSLHLRAESISSKKQPGQKSGKMKRANTLGGNINQAFVNDYDEFRNGNSSKAAAKSYESSSLKAMPQLNRDQIEKEYMEYKRQLDEKVSSSDSSSPTGTETESTNATTASTIPVVSAKTSGSTKRQSLNSIKAKKLAAKQAREQIWHI